MPGKSEAPLYVITIIIMKATHKLYSGKFSKVQIVGIKLYKIPYM